MDETSTDTSRIREWRSIITLIIFVATNVIVLFPFHLPLPVPHFLWDGVLGALRKLRIIRPDDAGDRGCREGRFKVLNFPINMVTAPLIADLFLLAILAIGRQEVYNGTVGANNIDPIDVMAFFITLAYIALSIDANGAIRFLACKVLQVSKNGRRLYFYLYSFFFGLTTFIGNDPIILSGTPFLAYITRVSNIQYPTAWIYMQFSIANIASAILVSSNPTNLVLTGAFNIKFINYTANIIVPVICTVVLLFPFLLWVIFRNESLIPTNIEMKKPSGVLEDPVNPNIPYSRVGPDDDDQRIREVLNPFLDKPGAIFGAFVMAATLITVLTLNATNGGHGNPVYWVTLPGAVVMFTWDMTFGWLKRQQTRDIARNGKREAERLHVMNAIRERHGGFTSASDDEKHAAPRGGTAPTAVGQDHTNSVPVPGSQSSNDDTLMGGPLNAEKQRQDSDLERQTELELENFRRQPHEPTTLVSLFSDAKGWARETFPTATTVFGLLPFPLVPFAFSMFVLVEALVTKGWIPVFAYGWHHWVNKTGTVGAIGGMGFVSVLLCNFSGTNIGTTILLCRVIQTWQQININGNSAISDRTFWGTVYSMALGVNYGAFSSAFSASLAGLLWRDILAKKGIFVGRFDFLRVNVPIITIAMVVGCTVLIGEIYVIRGNQPYSIAA